MPTLLFAPGRLAVLAPRQCATYLLAARLTRGQTTDYRLVRENDHWQLATP